MSEALEKGKCWASVLGGCAGGMSREHTVSECILRGPAVLVRGLHWCPVELKEVSVANLTANILCKRHNEELSPVDQEVKNLHEAFMRLDDDRASGRKPTRKQYLQLDGVRFTCWLCKTYCNFLVSDKQQPSQDLVSAAFRRGTQRRIWTSFPVTTGQVMDVVANEVLRFGDSRSDSGDFVAHFVLFGFPWLLLNFEPGPEELIDLPRGPGPVSGRQLLREPRGLAFKLGNSNHELVIRWPRRK